MDHESRWSELPEDLIHRILSFIPSTREAARLCLLCKCWLRAWQSYLEGPSFVFIERESSPSNLKKFYKFVEETMTKFTAEQPETKIHKLVLESAPWPDHRSSIRKSSPLADHHIIRENISEMTLFTKRIQVLRKLMYCSYWSWRRFNLSANYWYGRTPHVDLTDLTNLPSLRSLTLPATVISIRTVERILKGCPLLETLRCGIFITPNNNKLSRGISSKLTDEDDNYCSSKLKYLDLEITSFNTSEPLNEFLSKLGFLETLRISFKPSKCPRVAIISNQSVRNIELHIRGWIGQVIIDAPRLSCFRYTEHVFHWMYSGRLPISMINMRNKCRRAHLTLPFYNNIKFLNDLANLMGSFGDLRTLSIFYRPEVCLLNPEVLGDETYEGKALIPSSAVDQIEGSNLQIEVFSFSTYFEEVLDQVLGICRPSILTVATSGDWETKSGHEVLANREEEFKCRCSENVEYCWKHQLKEVMKIDEDKSSYKHIRLKLKW